MKRLRSILQSNVFLFLFLVITVSYCLFYNSFTHNSVYTNEKQFKGMITDILIDGNYLSMQIKAKEKLQCSYYFKSKEEKELFQGTYQLGDIILIEGVLGEPKNNTVPNIFNYKKYLYREGIFYILEIENYDKVESNKNLLYKVKNGLLNRINQSTKTGSYLNALILGDDRYIEENISNVYQQIGISHLFAISGMHIGLLGGIFLFVLKKLRLSKTLSRWIVILFLIFYLFLTGGSPSVTRAVVLFSLLSFNKIFKWNLSSKRIFLFTILFMIMLDPFIVFKVGFQFSSVVSGVLILFSSLINSCKHYFSKLFMTSFISFLTGVPICLYHFHQINIFSVLYNLFFVPWMSVFLFPMSLLTFIFPVFHKVLYFLIYILEHCATWCSEIPSHFIFRHPSIGIVFLYYGIILLLLLNWRKDKKLFFLFVILLTFHYHYNILVPSNYMIVIDIGQGDSILLHSRNQSILIDTGGRIKYNKESWQEREHSRNISDNTIIPLLKSLGIKKLDYLVFSHGDQDHLGEGINIISNFKVEKVLFNDGAYNDNERKIIELLEKKRIPFYKSKKGEQFFVGKLKLLSLNSDLKNENDSSIVFKVEINNKSILLTGDASIASEKALLQAGIGDIDILKVGHHGSSTSSSKEFIAKIKPEYAIISVGKNNRYHHPSKEVLDNLKHSTIYRTDLDGSIEVKLNENDYKIKTFNP